MALFVSHRERRLWIWTSVVVVAIYSTLGLARTLAEELRNRDLLDGVFFTCFLAVIAVTVIMGLQARPRGLEIGVALGVLAVYVMAFVRMAIPEERTHLIEYGIVALFILEALKERGEHGGHVRFAGPLAVAATMLVGVVDECIQALLPSRVFDVVDIGFDLVAAVLAVSARLAVGWARTRSTPSGRARVGRS